MNFRDIYRQAQVLRESAISLENQAEVILESNGAWAKVEECRSPNGDWDFTGKIHVVVPAHSGEESIWVSFKGVYSVVYGKPDVSYDTEFTKDEDAGILVFDTKSDAMKHNPDKGKRIIQSGLTDRRFESIVDFAMDRYNDTHASEWFIFNA